MSWRTFLLPLSAKYMTPAGLRARKTGLPNAAAVPKPSTLEAVPLPAMVCTCAVASVMERTRPHSDT